MNICSVQQRETDSLGLMLQRDGSVRRRVLGKAPFLVQWDQEGLEELRSQELLVGGDLPRRVLGGSWRTPEIALCLAP